MIMLEFCPVCDKNGSKSKIVLSQINLNEAVWLCESQECPWPFGYEDFTFVSRRIGEAWSSEWERHKPLVLKSSESFLTSLNELGLDTPPVTPGSGYDVVQKESVFKETTSCSITSPNLITNNVAKTKEDLRTKSSVDKSRHSNSEEFGSYIGESGKHSINSEGESSASSVQGSKRDGKSRESLNGGSNSLVNKNIPFKSDSVFSLSDDASFQSLENRVSSSQRSIDVCDAAEASTEAIFDVGKAAQKSLFSETTEDYKALSDSFVNPKHESTVKCTKWLSDNTKSTEGLDRSYLSDKSNNKIVQKILVSPQISAGSPQSDSSENTNGTKRLPKIKSIEKANIKFIGAVTAALDQRNSNRYIADPKTVDLPKCSNTASPVIKKGKQTISNNEIKTLTRTKESILITNADNRRNVNDKFLPDNCKAWKNCSGISKVEKRTVVIDGLPPISLSYQIPSFIEEPVNPSTDSSDLEKEGRVKIEPSKSSGVDNSVVRNNVEVNTTDYKEVGSGLPATSNQTELKRQSLKKPLKRTVHRSTKYQGFSFGALKKSKSNASHNEESIKTSLVDLPSPDNVSTCSDLTYTSETSCATTATGASRSESVSSIIDSSSKSISGIENFSSMTSCSDPKTSSSFSPENNDALDSSLNLDMVLDDLLFSTTDPLPQNLGDDWLTSLFD